MKKYLLISLLAINVTLLSAQKTVSNTIDSLTNLLNTNIPDTSKILIYADLTNEYFYNGDSVNTYKSYNNALALLKKVDFLKGEAKLMRAMGLVKYYKGDLRGAMENFEKSLSLVLKTGDKVGILKTYNNLGSLHMALDQFEEAIAELQKGFKLEQEYGFPTGEYVSINNMGFIYTKLKNYKKALQYFHIAKTKYEKDKNLKSLIFTYDGFSTVFSETKNLDSALFYAHKNMEASKAFGDVTSEMYGYMNLGTLYNKQGDLKKSEEYLNKSLNLSIELQDERIEMSCLANLAELNSKFKNHFKAKLYITKAMKIAKKHNILQDLEQMHAIYAQVLFQNGESDSAYVNLLKHIQIKDTLYQENITNKITEFEEKYQSEKKENEIKLLSKNKQLNEAKIKEQQMIEYVFAILIVALIFILYFIFRNLQQKRKANNLLEQKNNQILEINEELNQTNEEILAQRDQIEYQKQKIEHAHNEVKSSIRYAERIQKALLSTDDSWDKIGSERFILFRPRDVVSGDFYWAYANNDIVIWAAADCTGHGVPGAFMSMLGIGLLNEIVAEGGETDPGRILNILRAKIIKSLEQKSSDDERKDGMDIALCTLNKSTNTLYYAGANNPLTIVRHSEGGTTEESHDDIIVIKADKMPIGKYVNDDKPFTTHEIKLEKGDTIYTFTDGFQDQFGGPEGSKYMIKRLKEYLVGLREIPIARQKELLNQEFEQWLEVGKTEQIDDVCLIGVRV